MSPLIQQLATNKFSRFAVKCIGTHTQTDTDGAATLTKPAGATGIFIQNSSDFTSGGEIRYTIDGTTAATASVGFLLEGGDGCVRIDIFNSIKVYLAANSILEYQWFASE